MANDGPLIKIEHVRKTYDGVTAVEDLSFELYPGHVLGLLGANGAGKTTTIRMILNIIAPDSGEIEVLGRRIDNQTKDRIGYMPEERGLYKKMKVEELLHFFGAVNGMSRSDAKKETEYWLKRLDLWDRRQSTLEDFSKGMQQKVQFVATVMHRPPLLILDEPFSGLDPVNARLFEELIGEFGESGTGVIFSTHVMEQAERMLDDVIMLRKGEVVVQGALDEVQHQFGAGWIEVRGEGCEAALEGFDGVKAKRPHGKSLRYQFESQIEPKAVLQHLVGAGVEVERFVQLEASLNDIFLARVGGLEIDTIGNLAEPTEAHA
ncbi:ATP-binding cassette domain-containing protein [bacterium]|nr:ATP-binding cassette domain-containing protein [bacterium]